MADATSGAVSLAEENGIDLAQIVGTGSGGKITVEDVRRAIAEREPESKIGPEINPFAPGAENLREWVTVRFTGPTHAVLSGRLILSGETREITRLQLKIALAQRPGQYVVVGEVQGKG